VPSFRLFKKFTATLTLALFLSQAVFPVRGARAAQVVANMKSDMAMPDIDQQKESLQKPNVLFLIEATEIMSFTTKGVQPQVWRDALFDFHWEETADWKLTKKNYGYTIYDINRIMKQATFGMGAMPPAWRGGNLSQGRNLYGRDRDSSNNFVKSKDLASDIEQNKGNYYFPFADEDYAARYLKDVYSGQTTALETAYTNYPSSVWPDDVLPRDYKYEKLGKAGYDQNSYNGNSVLTPYEYASNTAAAKAYPYALVFQDPKYWADPPPSMTNVALVPNDSRMYKTKLVLWNLLNDGDRFKDMRIGMATTFLSPANLERAARQNSQNHHEIAWDQNPDTNGIFKVYPFGANIRTKSYFLPEKMGGDAYIKDLGARNSTNWSQTNVYRRKERPTGASGQNYHKIQYENGTMHGPSTGEVESFFHVHGQHYPLWHNATTHAQYMTPNNDGSEPDGWWSNGAVPADVGPKATKGNVSTKKGWYEGTKSITDYGDTARQHDNDVTSMSEFNERHTVALDPKREKHSAGEVWDRPLYKLLRRASLWVPIREADYVWKKGGLSMTQADKFRLWINGLADIRSDGDVVTDWYEHTWADNHKYLSGTRRDSQFYWYNDPEIGVAGMFGLAQAIFPDPTPLDYTPGHTNPTYPSDRLLQLDRNYYRTRGWVWYSKRSQNINYTYDYRRATQEYDDTAVPRARFNKGSGEAAGSVLDFFSPKRSYYFQGTDAIRTDDDYISVTQPQIKDSGGSNSIAATDLHRVSFPIRSECEDNWLIVVASGSEPKIVDPNAYSYSSWEAIKNLFDATDKRNKGKAIPAYDTRLPNHGVRKAAYEQVTRIKPDVFWKKDADGKLTESTIGTESGRALNRTDLEEIDLDNPIRTLVIGLVAKETDKDVIDAGPAVVTEVQNMRLNLIKMANAGQGKLTGEEIAKITVDNMYDKRFIQPYWADNVASLEVAFDAALGTIQQAQEPKAVTSAMPQVKTGSSVEDSQLFSATYQVIYNNQWAGSLRRLLPVVKNGRVVSMDTAGSWELGGELLAKRGDGDAPGNIKPLYWVPDDDGGSFKVLSQKAATDLNIFGLDGKLTANGGEPTLPANEAMYIWLTGYDHSYSKNLSYKRANMLADFGQSGLTAVVNPNKSLDALPGYSEWAKKQSDANVPMIYAQTNDGLLYAVDIATGDPEKIILPPPSLLPVRLASLKTTAGADGKRVWMDVATEDAETAGKRSRPGFILDGALQVRNFDLGNGSNHDWRQLLLGSLGRGGNGLYMMDVSDHKNPKFMWYKEKYNADGKHLDYDKSYVVTMDSNSSVSSAKWLDASALDGAESAWLKLGDNAPKPAMGVVFDGKDTDGNPSTRNIVVVPGGLQNAISLDKNGGEGAVLMILDPKDGSVIKAFDSDTLVAGSAGWRVGSGALGRTPYMGMLVSEPTLLASTNPAVKKAKYLTSQIYTADNRGNIFAVETEKQDGSAMAPAAWNIRTAASLQPKVDGAGTGNNFAIPHGVAVMTDGPNAVWLAGGTADVESKASGGIANGDGKIGQMLFSVKTSIHPKDEDGTIFRDEMTGLDVRSDTTPPSANGWYMPLDTVESTGGKITEDEYMTTKPFVMGGDLYATTFVTTKIDVTGAFDICNMSSSGIQGDSRLYQRNVKSGASGIKARGSSNKTGFLQIPGIKITSETDMLNDDGSHTIEYVYEPTGGEDPFENPELLAWLEENGYIVDRVNKKIYKIIRGGAGTSMPPATTVIYYWQMK
jgi:hypothetical protein